MLKCLLKKESFELGFEVRERGKFRKLAGSEFKTAGAMKLKEQSPTDLRLRFGIFKIFPLEDRSVRVV